MPANMSTGSRPPPIWRYDAGIGEPEQAPLIAAAPIPPVNKPGFFASEGQTRAEADELNGPYDRRRPYWRYRSPLVSAVIAVTSNSFTWAVSGGLSFTGLSPLTLNTSKLTTATLSFTGITNLGKAITKSLVTAVLSFTGSFKKATTTALAAATLSFTGTFRAIAGKTLAATLTFTGPTNLLNSITKKLTVATLSFTGTLAKATTKALVVATLSFTGSIVKLTSKGLGTAVLSFTGAQSGIRISIVNLVTAVLTFTGPTNLLKSTSKRLTVATLTFTGPTNLLKVITKGLTVAVLTFTGSIKRFTSKYFVNVYKQTIIRDAPLLYYRFDDKAFPTVTDYSGNGYTGAAGSQVIYNWPGAIGDYDTAMILPSRTFAAITTTSAAPLHPGDTFSFEIWVNFDTSITTTSRVFFTSDFQIKTASGSAGQLLFLVGSNTLATTTSGYGNGLWHHLVWTKSTSTSKIYIDGVDVTPVITDFTVPSGTADLFWGGNGGGSAPGVIVDEGALYNYALSAAVVTEHYNTGILRNPLLSFLSNSLSFDDLRKDIKTMLTLGVPAILSFTGAITNNKIFIRALAAATLTFTGPTNLLKNTTKGLVVAILTFIGKTLKSTVTGQFTAALSFVGNIVLRTGKFFTGGLSFTGAFASSKTFIRALVTAVLTFTGPTNLVKNISKGVAPATLSFTGPPKLLLSISKLMTAGVSFAGTLLRAIKVSMASAALTFTGALTKLTSKILTTATLSFTGTFFKQTGKRLITAILSFTGPTRVVGPIGKALSGVLTFTGPTNLRNASTKGMASTLSFVGTTLRQTRKTLVTAVLSLTGAFTGIAGGHFTQVMAGTLAFTGAIIKQTSTQLTLANLTFTGSKSISTLKRMVGILTFAGTNRRAIVKTTFLGVLTFTGLTLRQFNRTLVGATLSFVGVVNKLPMKNLQAALTFTGVTNLPKAIKIGLRSTLTFVGNLFFPGRFSLAKVGIQLNSIPINIDIAVTETLPFVVDVSNYLQAGDTVSKIYASLINASTGNPVTVLWRNAITVSGNFVTIPILGSTLNLGQTYQMTIVFVASSVKYATFITYITVVA